MQLNISKVVRMAAVAALGSVAVSTAGLALPPDNASPTCSDTMGITNHGQHIVGDYVMGTGSGDLQFPPAGDVGQVVSENGGAALPGGPGPAFHFPNGIAPGASFCNDSNSPGAHL